MDFQRNEFLETFLGLFRKNPSAYYLLPLLKIKTTDVIDTKYINDSGTHKLLIVSEEELQIDTLKYTVVTYLDNSLYHTIVTLPRKYNKDYQVFAKGLLNFSDEFVGEIINETASKSENNIKINDVVFKKVALEITLIYLAILEPEVIYAEKKRELSQFYDDESEIDIDVQTLRYYEESEIKYNYN